MGYRWDAADYLKTEEDMVGYLANIARAARPVQSFLRGELPELNCRRELETWTHQSATRGKQSAPGEPTTTCKIIAYSDASEPPSSTHRYRLIRVHCRAMWACSCVKASHLSKRSALGMKYAKDQARDAK